MTRKVIVAKGKHGQEYEFEEYSLDEPLPEYGGVYIVYKKKLMEKKKFSYFFVSIGETANFSETFENYVNWDRFVAFDASVVGLLQMDDEDDRIDLETELTSIYEPEDLPDKEQ